MRGKKFEISKEQLEQDLKDNLAKDVAKKYGVGADCIWVHAKKLGIKLPPRYRPDKKIIGKRFGRLLVLSIDESYQEKKPHPAKAILVRYFCKCDCGKIKSITKCSLNSGRCNSCGCYSDECRRTSRWTGYKRISGRYWYHIKSGAIARKLEFDLTIEYIWKIFEEQDGKCALTGQPLEFYDKLRGVLEETASLDRIDNSKGYIIGNVQWVHKKINKLKHAFNQEELINLCTLVADYNRNKVNANS